MNFKKKLKAFFTLTRQANGGFTLVELVIVIAILAILAGVAVPVYSSYIKKAGEAADQLLIAAVNEAFAGGCMEAGIDVATVQEATVSVSEQMVFGVSSVKDVSEDNLNVICNTFNLLFEGNFTTPFVTENVKSLYWVPVESSFKMDHENSVPSRIVLSNGKSFTVDPETMAQIQASTYADMGYAEVAEIIDNLSSSCQTLVGIAQGLHMDDKFTAVLLANGLIANTSAADGMSPTQMANGLQMVAAKYLAGASEEEINELLGIKLGGNLPLVGGTTTGMLQNIVDGTGGTKTISAMAIQYALVEAYASSSASDGATISYRSGFNTYTYNSVSEFLASDKAKNDPVWALNLIKDTQEYKNYTATEQHQNDVTGFVGTLSLLGDNIGTTTNPGAVDINDYLNNGVHSQDAVEGLTSVLGK